jgi:LemA protein
MRRRKKVLIGVTEARSRATSIQVTPEVLNDPEALQRFQAAQGQLTSALKRLPRRYPNNYPQLKSDQNFRDLQAQLEGTENRIAVARNRYIAAVESYNATVRRFPTNLTAMVFKHAAEGELHGRERSRNRQATEREFRSACAGTLSARS